MQDLGAARVRKEVGFVVLSGDLLYNDPAGGNHTQDPQLSGRQVFDLTASLAQDHTLGRAGINLQSGMVGQAALAQKLGCTNVLRDSSDSRVELRLGGRKCHHMLHVPPMRNRCDPLMITPPEVDLRVPTTRPVAIRLEHKARIRCLNVLQGYAAG